MVFIRNRHFITLETTVKFQRNFTSSYKYHSNLCALTSLKFDVTKKEKITLSVKMYRNKIHKSLLAITYLSIVLPCNLVFSFPNYNPELYGKKFIFY